MFARVARVPVVGRVNAVGPVVVKVVANAPFVVKELLFANASVAPPAVGMIARLLIEVAVATPKAGVTNVGLFNVAAFENTTKPFPCSSLNAAAKPAEFTNKSCLVARAAVAALSA